MCIVDEGAIQHRQITVNESIDASGEVASIVGDGAVYDCHGASKQPRAASGAGPVPLQNAIADGRCRLRVFLGHG